jgi:hypothetical protein
MDNHEDDHETTRRIDRAELLGLLDMSAPAARQRITEPMPAVRLGELLIEEDPPEIVIVRFRSRRLEEAPPVPLPRMMTIAVGFSVTMLVFACIAAIAR